jgi:hypothetical protein
VPIGVRAHLNRSVTEPRLHHLERQFEPAVDAPVDAPRGVEVAQRVQPSVLGVAIGIGDAGLLHQRDETTFDDAGVIVDVAGVVGEDEILFALRAGETMLAQYVHHHRKQRHAALTRL